MIRYTVRRLISMFVVVITIISLVFVITRLLPADPARVAAGLNAGPEQVAAVRASLGLDRPILDQYRIYMGRLARLDFGASVQTRQAVAKDLKAFFPATIELTLTGILVYVCLATGLGVIAAVNRQKERTTIDGIIRLLSIGGNALPAFWAALLLQLLFFRWLGFLPAGGRLDVGLAPPTHITGLYLVDSLLTLNWETFINAAKHLVLPVTALVAGPLPVGLRVVRLTVLGELAQPYAQTARAKGVREQVVLMRHVLRNAMIPIVTLFSVQLGYLFGGAFFIEVVFMWPGIGRYAVSSISAFDYNAMTAITIVVSVLFVLINFLTDIAYGILDPRARVA